MSRNRAIGRLSYRGILALFIGLVFISFSVKPELFNDDIPPFPVRLIMAMAGAGLFFAGIASQLFVWRRSQLIRTQRPLAAEICVIKDDDTERNTETVHVRMNGRCQALGVDRSGVVSRLIDGKVRWGDVWLDDCGRVHAIAISGEHFNTLIGGREIPAGCFGEKS
jgi:hypothetical protein